MVYLKWISTLPMLTILALNYLGTGRAGITQKNERMATSFISVVIPAIFLNDAVDDVPTADAVPTTRDNLEIPKFQKSYYCWNRNVLATVLFLCVGLVVLIVNTDYFNTFEMLCHIHAMPHCHQTLHLDVGQFNTVVVPLILATGLLTLVPQLSEWLNGPLKYHEQIVKDENRQLKRETSRGKEKDLVGFANTTTT
eukprot:GFUD01118545.1.p1 GENE.GFUD01118545.1~~GFUD01118545.1.p1  ORF type:complete len:214 (-),score=43.77 GFUD01118545.1:42-629(-)